MLKSKCVSCVFFLAFAVSIAQFIAHRCSVHLQSQSFSISELASLVHFSNSNFISGAQAEVSSKVNSDEEIEEVEDDDDDCFISGPCIILAVPSSYKLSFPTFRASGSPLSQLLGVHSLRAPPALSA